LREKVLIWEDPEKGESVLGQKKGLETGAWGNSRVSAQHIGEKKRKGLSRGKGRRVEGNGGRRSYVCYESKKHHGGRTSVKSPGRGRWFQKVEQCMKKG